MPCVIESQASCLPVSALEYTRLRDGSSILFAGQGPYLIVYVDGSKLLSHRVFETQSVHGIRIASEPKSWAKADLFNVVIWGGGLVQSVRLTLDTNKHRTRSSGVQLVLATEFDAKDWILDAVFLSSSIFLLTAHNVLVDIPISCRETRNGLACEKSSVIHGPAAFLYSGDLLIASSDLIIVAAGTVFGEILVWTCFRDPDREVWLTSTRHVFTGHKGSVFGVAISEVSDLMNKATRLLASCSDDRTIQLWDISDCEELSHKGTPSTTTTNTGFGSIEEGEECALTSAWGHSSRIWGVEFVTSTSNNEAQEVLLLSRGEDAVCQLWSIKGSKSQKPNDLRLIPAANVRHHLGKHAWSMSHGLNDQDLTVFTGGADGQIISRHFGRHGSLAAGPTTISTVFKNITGSSLALKHYCPINQNICFATTDSGDLFSITAEQGELKCSHIYSSPQKGAILLCNVEFLGVVLLAQQRGALFAATLNHADPLMPFKLSVPSGICWMQVASSPGACQLQSVACVVAALTNGDAVIIWLTVEGGSLHIKHRTLDLPQTFVITASAYDISSGALLLGSRAGALAVYPNLSTGTERIDEPFCVRHIHGSDSVTSISVLESSRSTQGFSGLHILTTGRDGTFAIHQLDQARLSLSTVHISSPSFGPNIEGAYLSPRTNPSDTETYDLVLYGFRSTSFVVWNETQLSTVMSVECGGAHRSWAYNDSILSTSPSRRRSLTEDFEVLEPTKTFVWTKAGKLNWYSMQEPGHTFIQRGGHGREIKAIARSSRCLHGRPLIATGAEDTNIHLFSMDGDPGKTSFQNIAVLNRHTTGLQHLLFSRSGTFLFSSAGCEEFYIWKLTFDVPYFNMGVVLWDMMPKEEDDSDARIMSFDVLESKPTPAASTNNHQSPLPMEESYTLALAYSNGKCKVIRYIPSSARDQGEFETLREIQYGSFCVMQAFFLSQNQNQTQILSAGTNGYLNLSGVKEAIALTDGGNPLQHVSPSIMEVHKVHQSSILCMDVLALDSKTKMYLVATGGDDNALGLSLLTPISDSTEEVHLDGNKHDLLRHRLRTILIPRAHAAAITALKFASLLRTKTGYTVTVVSVGNDQRVKVWKVYVDLKRAMSSFSQPMDTEAESDGLFKGIQIERLGSAWTSVADVSGLEAITESEINEAMGDLSTDVTTGESHEDGCRVLVTGVGMELLSVKTHGNDSKEMPTS
ncbi:WD40-repeat-containing domain protein [Exophiala viscosa]|uniref:WD40-repeat-containing domain protein n=1 Tax=Exophiala viscosa TaxID=2486360 RepID=A0AAN6DZ84_9EURO|nr:WD40-repeat-containing domain protein [Exophiala viscosa]KAI1621654.1 WD40-repeat-containing domain protein [Exophiala viscosa]